MAEVAPAAWPARSRWQAAVVPAVAVAVDLLWGEPPTTLHPVAWMGRVVAALERRAPAEKEEGAGARLAYGGAMVAATVALFVLPAWLLERALWRAGRPAGGAGEGGAGSRADWSGAVALGLALKPAFAVRELLRAAARVGEALAREDLPGAREGLRGLVSRETAALPPPLLAAAAIESVAENCSDSVVAPLFYYGLGGLPGAVAYRVLNTLDAMVGYRTPRYERLGKVAARADDLANLLPARLTGLLLVLAAPLAGGSAGEAWRVMRRDHWRTASPNAGWPMSAAAGALGVSLEKAGHYRLYPEGRPPGASDVGRAIALTRAALALGAPFLLALLLLAPRGARSRWR